MKWIAPAAKDPGTATLEKRLWDAADELRANSGLKAGQYSSPVLGLIFLRFADARFAACRAKLEKAATGRRGSRVDDAGSYQAEGVLFLPAESRFSELLEFPEGGKDKKSLGEAVDDAMRGVERENPQLSGVLPKTYQRFQARTLKELVKTLSTIPVDLAGDLFGKIYEYFLGEFAMSEGQGGGEFYTPLSIVRLIVEVLEPFEGRVLDPACGSGGMFVQSARFVAEHNKNGRRGGISIHGIEKTDETGQLCRLNLAVHGLEGDIRHGGDINSYYEDPHNAVGRFDFVLANPPFNVDKVDKDNAEVALWLVGEPGWADTAWGVGAVVVLIPLTVDTARSLLHGDVGVDAIEHVRRGESFAFETTLSDRGHARSILKWRALGYHVSLWFLSLPSSESALVRVARRVQQGGHAIPDDVVCRRFNAGRRNFDHVYKTAVDDWALYDNSGPVPVLLDWGENL